MKHRQISYSPIELDWIKSHSKLPRREALALFHQAFTRLDISLADLKSLCTRKGWLTGRTGRLEKGNIPANKGQKMPFNANSAATRFKKSNTPRNTKWLGHERLGKDGYVWISVDEVNPHTGYNRRYAQKHTWLWTKKNGPVPKGLCLKCLDGNRANCDPSNWEAVPRALLPRLAGGNRYHNALPYDAAPAELKPTLLATAKLQHALRKRRKVMEETAPRPEPPPTNRVISGKTSMRTIRNMK